jgi:hypothetical protein
MHATHCRAYRGRTLNIMSSRQPGTLVRVNLNGAGRRAADLKADVERLHFAKRAGGGLMPG